MTKAPQRHSLVWLDPHLDISNFAANPVDASAAREWICNGLPLVVARQPQQDSALASIAVGLTLPPPACRKRVSLVVPSEAIIRQGAPMDLVLAMSAVAAPCRELILRVVSMCEETNVSPCVYGSALWQTVSGCQYMTAKSDLDVLFICNDSSNVRRLLDLLVGCEGSIPRLDGELMAPSGWAAAWREVAAAGSAGGPETVLAKSSHKVQLLKVDQLLGVKGSLLWN